MQFQQIQRLRRRAQNGLERVAPFNADESATQIYESIVEAVPAMASLQLTLEKAAFLVGALVAYRQAVICQPAPPGACDVFFEESQQAFVNRLLGA